MLLDALQDFEWENDPAEVTFGEAGMRIKSLPKTDFWQSYRQDFHQDNGHFFFKKISGNFTITVCWRFMDISGFCQCGLMGRINQFNWFKASVMSDGPGSPFIGSSLTNFGTSDLASERLPTGTEEIWYRLQSKNNSLVLSYSLDGKEFYQIRLFEFSEDYKELQIGAYICCPSDKNFSALLDSIEII